jgi:hypothetical protein
MVEDGVQLWGLGEPRHMEFLPCAGNSISVIKRDAWYPCARRIPEFTVLFVRTIPEILHSFFESDRSPCNKSLNMAGKY